MVYHWHIKVAMINSTLIVEPVNLNDNAVDILAGFEI